MIQLLTVQSIAFFGCHDTSKETKRIYVEFWWHFQLKGHFCVSCLTYWPKNPPSTTCFKICKSATLEAFPNTPSFNIVPHWYNTCGILFTHTSAAYLWMHYCTEREFNFSQKTVLALPDRRIWPNSANPHLPSTISIWMWAILFSTWTVHSFSFSPIPTYEPEKMDCTKWETI
jgi:hypothetical protein